MRSGEKKICFQMRLEMRWGVNEAEIYKTLFFSPWSFLNSVTNDSLRFWGLWPEKTHHDQGGSRRMAQSLTTIAFCLVLSWEWFSCFILLAFVYHLNRKGNRCYVWVPNPKGRRHKCAPTEDKEDINTGTKNKALSSNSFPRFLQVSSISTVLPSFRI